MNKNILEKAGKSMPYEVPTGFFEQLDTRLQEATQGGVKKQTRTIPLWKITSAAAVVAVALISGAFLFTNQPLTPNGIGEVGIAKVDTPNHATNAPITQQNAPSVTEEEPNTKELPISETKAAAVLQKNKTTNSVDITKVPEKKTQITRTVRSGKQESTVEVSDPLNLYTPDANDAQSEQILMDLAEADIFMNQYMDN